MDELSVANHILAFDGRVLEIFGQLAGSGANRRWHVRDLAVSIEGPDRKGRHAVQFKVASSNTGRCRLEIEDDEWTFAEPFLRRVQEAVGESSS
jgi:hypothetical protein